MAASSPCGFSTISLHLIELVLLAAVSVHHLVDLSDLGLLDVGSLLSSLTLKMKQCVVQLCKSWHSSPWTNYKNQRFFMISLMLDATYSLYNLHILWNADMVGPRSWVPFGFPDGTYEAQNTHSTIQALWPIKIHYMLQDFPI